MEYDAKASEKDKYDRILAWVWVDDSLLQEELVSNGLAKTYMLQNNYKYASNLQLAETEAKNNKINIWSDEEISLKSDDKAIQNESNEVIMGIIGFIVIIAIILISALIGYSKKKRVTNKK